MNIIERLADRATRRHEQRITNGGHYRDDVDDLGGVAANRATEYRLAVGHGANREELGRILEALGGCELATAHLYTAMGPRIAPGHAETTRLSGLLLLEIAWAAGDPDSRPGGEVKPFYRGVRNEFEFGRGGIPNALKWLALAYQGWAPEPRGNLAQAGPAPTVAQRLRELMDTVRGVIPGQPTETLAVLVSIHEDGKR